MKKLVFVFVAGLGMTLMSCSGAAEQAEEAATAVETTAEETVNKIEIGIDSSISTEEELEEHGHGHDHDHVH